jgi:hypothetical protein
LPVSIFLFPVYHCSRPKVFQNGASSHAPNVLSAPGTPILMAVPAWGAWDVHQRGLACKYSPLIFRQVDLPKKIKEQCFSFYVLRLSLSPNRCWYGQGDKHKHVTPCMTFKSYSRKTQK